LTDCRHLRSHVVTSYRSYLTTHTCRSSRFDNAYTHSCYKLYDTVPNMYNYCRTCLVRLMLFASAHLGELVHYLRLVAQFEGMTHADGHFTHKMLPKMIIKQLIRLSAYWSPRKLVISDCLTREGAVRHTSPCIKHSGLWDMARSRSTGNRPCHSLANTQSTLITQ
jgi:hypothetical protein